MYENIMELFKWLEGDVLRKGVCRYFMEHWRTVLSRFEGVIRWVIKFYILIEFCSQRVTVSG